jgi:predicted RNase H-like HicB family nuclease
MRLLVSIYKDEDGFYIAECPALSGCMSQGDTEEEALAGIKDAIRVWLASAQDLGREVSALPQVVEVEV